MEEETRANTEVAVTEVAQFIEQKHSRKKEEEEPSLDEEFVKVEKETFDMKGNSLAEAKAVEKIDPTDASSSKGLLEFQEKLRQLEIELAQVTKALKESGFENVHLKDQLSSAKEKLVQMAGGEQKLSVQLKALQEDMEALLSKHMELSGIKEALQHLNAEHESSEKKMKELEQALQSSVSDASKFEELHIQSSQEVERICEAAKVSEKEAEDQICSLEEELKVLREKIEASVKSTRLQLQEREAKLEAVELKNKELEHQLTLFESKHSDTDRELKEHVDKLSGLNLKLKDRETEKEQMNGQMQEHRNRVSEMESTLELLMQQKKAYENRAAHSLSESNSQLKGKLDELQQLMESAAAEKEEATRQLAARMNTITQLTAQHSRSSELQSEIEARILEVELQLLETIEKLALKELEVKEFGDRLSSAEENIQIHEVNVRESSKVAESRKVELDHTLVKVQDQENTIEALKAKLEQLEKHTGALAEANMKLNEELAGSESKLNHLQSKLSAAVAEKDDAVKNLNSSVKIVEGLTQQLASERLRLQTEILSIMEQKQYLKQTNVAAQNDLQMLITELDGQLKECQKSNEVLKVELENLRLEAAQNSALQAKVKELEEKLLVTEAGLRKEVESLQASAAAKEVDLSSRQEQHMQKAPDEDAAVLEKVHRLEQELASAKYTIVVLKEEKYKLVSAQESAVKQTSEELEGKRQQVSVLEKHVKELEQKLKLESISKEQGDEAQVRSRDMGSNLSSPTPSASRETPANTIKAPSSLNSLKLVLAVALVSIIIGLILGKIY